MPEHPFTVHTQLPVITQPETLCMDLYIPTDNKPPVPCIIVIQGGGFKSQDGKRFRPFAEDFARNGFAAALISYRGRPDVTYKETMRDVRAAVRAVTDAGKTYGIDPARLGAMGRSAGATITALLALTDIGQTGEPARIRAAAGIAGVYDFITRFTDGDQTALQEKLETKKLTNGEWLGTPFAPDDADWRNASAINHVDAGDPPFLLLHSRNDPVVPWMQSRDMQARLQQAGVRAELVLRDTGKHGGPADAQALMVEFFKNTLTNK